MKYAVRACSAQDSWGKWFGLHVLVTWFVFFLHPFVGLVFVVVGLLRDPRYRVHYSAMAALLFAGFAYWFVPSHEMDLTRYFRQLSVYADIPWQAFVKEILPTRLLVIQELLFYAVAKSGNHHLLPAIVVFVTYFVLLYLVTDFCVRRDIGKGQMATMIAIILAIFPFPVVVSNVRNILAFSLFSLAVYRDLEQGRRGPLTYVLYVTPVFIHISTLVLVILRLMVYWYRCNSRFRALIVDANIKLIHFWGKR